MLDSSGTDYDEGWVTQLLFVKNREVVFPLSTKAFHHALQNTAKNFLVSKKLFSHVVPVLRLTKQIWLAITMRCVDLLFVLMIVDEMGGCSLSLSACPTQQAASPSDGRGQDTGPADRALSLDNRSAIHPCADR